jgi:hypothetical protein
MSDSADKALHNQQVAEHHAARFESFGMTEEAGYYRLKARWFAYCAKVLNMGITPMTLEEWRRSHESKTSASPGDTG